MKKIFLALMTVAAMVCMTACDKDTSSDNGGGTTPTPEEPATLDIQRTSWQGVYEGTVVHPQAGNVPCILTWTLDFVDETNVSIMLDIAAAEAGNPTTVPFTATMSGFYQTGSTPTGR